MVSYVLITLYNSPWLTGILTGTFIISIEYPFVVHKNNVIDVLLLIVTSLAIFKMNVASIYV